MENGDNWECDVLVIGSGQDELGERFDPVKVDAFLDNGPRMVEFFERRTSVRFIDGNAIPDFHAGRPPAGVLTLRGMALASGRELAHFLNAPAEIGGRPLDPPLREFLVRRADVIFGDRLLPGRRMEQARIRATAPPGRRAQDAPPLSCRAMKIDRIVPWSRLLVMVKSPPSA